MDDSVRLPLPCPDDILSQCAALMARKGYDGTSMRDLARTTGRSLAGLYHHFSGKEELLFLINERGFQPLLENATALQETYAHERAAAPRAASERLLRALIDAHVGYFAAHLDQMRVLMFGTQSMSSAHGEAIRRLKARYAACVRHAVGEYLAAHDRPADAAVIERKSFLLFGMMNWIFGWYSFDEHGPAQDLAAEIHATFTQGCLHGPDPAPHHG